MKSKYVASLCPLALAICSVVVPPTIWAGGNNIKDGVPLANMRSGHPDNVVADGFKLVKLVDGSNPIENPSGVITRFGLLDDSPNPNPVEPTKTEPDENLYLVFDKNPGGPAAGYNYGRHFLYQGHENSKDLAYVTRINLDVTDPAHRVTLLTPTGADGKTHFNSIDGSTWDPFSKTLLFTQEAGNTGGVIEITAGWPAKVRTMYEFFGRGGFEGIHPDDRGNVIIVEDAGGSAVPAFGATPKRPNSYVYRFVPVNASDLSKGGVLQALQISIGGQAVIWSDNPYAIALTDAQQLKLHTPGTSYPVRWITVHDSTQCAKTDSCASFDANAEARAAGATPLKRPENGQFKPGTDFSTFFFDVTGDTDANIGNVPELAARGSWGGIFRADFNRQHDDWNWWSKNKKGEWGRLSLVVLGDQTHNSFDNLAFTKRHTLLAAEDRGDTLHKQLNALDSIWAFDVRRADDGDDDDDDQQSALRFIALGRDTASEFDANNVTQNEGDNEPTGVYVSDGDPSVRELLGTKIEPNEMRWFFTQQHGLNQVFEIVQDKH